VRREDREGLYHKVAALGIRGEQQPICFDPACLLREATSPQPSALTVFVVY